MSQLLTALERDNGPTALQALALAMVGVISTDLPMHQWNAVLYDLVMLLQNQLLTVGAQQIAQQAAVPPPQP